MLCFFPANLTEVRNAFFLMTFKKNSRMQKLGRVLFGISLA